MDARTVFQFAFQEPFECFVCRRPMAGWGSGLQVHHIDEDKANNHPYNLAPVHSTCHKAYHVAKKGRSMTRNVHLQFMVTPEERVAVKAAAAAEGVKTAEYIRQRVLPPDPLRENERVQAKYQVNGVHRRAESQPPPEPPQAESGTSPEPLEDRLVIFEQKVKAKRAKGKTRRLAEIEAREELGL